MEAKFWPPFDVCPPLLNLHKPGMHEARWGAGQQIYGILFGMTGKDTIFALSSGNLPSGVAVIRMSGPHCRQVLAELCGTIPEPRQARLLSIRKRNDEVLDRGLILFFPEPASFTGEDCVELQVHGGRAVVKAILDHLSELPGMRHATSGEFSRRAFHNGKLDLLQVEGLSDLIQAETEMQRRLAAEHAAGGLSKVYAEWASRLTHARAMIEAELDFADEEDVPVSVSDAIWIDMRSLHAEVEKHLDGFSIGETIRDGFKIVIAGLPNVGKSSLINYLMKRDIAIVTDIPGTTRDVLSADMILDGFSLRFFDTAGLRQTDELVEKEGIRRARLVAEEADVVLWLFDDPTHDQMDADTQLSVPIIKVGTKFDLDEGKWLNTQADVVVSTRTGRGTDILLDLIRSHLPNLDKIGGFSLPTRKRHIECLIAMRTAIADAFNSAPEGLDVQAEFLRVSAYELGKITGRVDIDDVLDVIFSEFCIGK